MIYLKSISILVMMIILLGCGKEFNRINDLVHDVGTVNKVILDIDSEFEPYFSSFMQKSGCFTNRPRFNNLTIRMHKKLKTYDNGQKQVGFCEKLNKFSIYTSIVPRVISISEEYWAKASLVQREKLIYHELGHCTLDLEHSSDPKDIMSVHMEDSADDEYRDNYTENIKGLFESESSCNFSFSSALYGPTDIETFYLSDGSAVKRIIPNSEF